MSIQIVSAQTNMLHWNHPLQTNTENTNLLKQNGDVNNLPMVNIATVKASIVNQMMIRSKLGLLFVQVSTKSFTKSKRKNSRILDCVKDFKCKNK